MPWNKKNYPDSFKNLETSTRHKAIEIANALLRDGYEEDRAIPIALDQAKKTEAGDEDRPVYEIKKHEDGWQLKKKSSNRAILIEETKDSLLSEAKRYVNKNHGELHIYTEDGSLAETLYE